MRILLGPTFRKQYKKLPKSVRQKFDQRVLLFIQEPFHPLLGRHPLHGKYTGYQSINVTGNYRAIFEELAPDAVQFVAIGTHPELYGG